MIDLLSKWPLVRQIRERKDGTGLESMSDKTRAMHARIDNAQVARSVCPYCGVGCGQLIYHKEGKLISIEGDPASPISRGRLCPKGSATKSLHDGPLREYKVKYRRPYGTQWEELSLDDAMDMIADRIVEARAADWDEQNRRTMSIANLGGATLDNEENYLIKKLCMGLGVVQVENQARI